MEAGASAMVYPYTGFINFSMSGKILIPHRGIRGQYKSVSTFSQDVNTITEKDKQPVFFRLKVIVC